VTLKTPVADTPLFREHIAALRPADRAIRNASGDGQTLCPVTGAELGSMGDPIATEVEGRKLWTCCDACPPKVKANPAKYLAKLASGGPNKPAAVAQNICPVTGAKLGSMGDPVAVEVTGRTVLTCCAACPPKLKANPARYLARLAPPPQDAVLTVPESAVIDTGRDKVVYVETEPGVFEGRRVVLGPRSGDRFPVLEGVAVGERVAASGAFLIDAESRLNPATRGGTPENAEPPEPEKNKNRDEAPAPKHEHAPTSRTAAGDGLLRR